jgi:hypothetical protein
MNVAIQTTRIVIDIPPRAAGAPPVPVVTATRSSVLLDDEGQVVGKLAGSDDTRVLANVTSIPEFPAVHATLSAAIEAAFAPPAPEPEPEPVEDPTAGIPDLDPEPAP